MAKKSKNDGRALEHLTAFIEELKLPPGFTVEINKRVKSPSGEDEAELDIVIAGRIGSANFQWLIECRDRPASSAAPVAWIEQLIGRQQRYRINKVTAVSTQHFSKPAVELASRHGIDLRQVKSLSGAEFEDWLKMPSYQFSNRKTHLLDMQIVFPETTPDSIFDAAQRKVAAFSGQDAILTRVADGERVFPKDAFNGASHAQDIFANLEPNQPPKRVKFGIKYVNPDDCFGIETELGFARIEAIVFDGEVSIEETLVPLEEVLGYDNVEHATALSQTAMFASQQIGDNHWALTLHKDLETGETGVFLVPSKPKTSDVV